MKSFALTIGASEYFALWDNFVTPGISTLDCLYIAVSVYLAMCDNSGTLHFKQSEYFERLIDNSDWLKGEGNEIITLILGAAKYSELPLVLFLFFK